MRPIIPRSEPKLDRTTHSACTWLSPNGALVVTLSSTRRTLCSSAMRAARLATPSSAPGTLSAPAAAPRALRTRQSDSSSRTWCDPLIGGTRCEWINWALASYFEFQRHCSVSSHFDATQLFFPLTCIDASSHSLVALVVTVR